MIAEIYGKIKERLEMMPQIRHVDLWNRNVEFLEDEVPWERPAVFVEFAPVKWRILEPGVEYRSEPEVRLHIVTDWTEGATDQLDLPVLIHGQLSGLDGESFFGFDIEESDVNHDHGELVESVEVYRCEGIRVLGDGL